METIPEAFSDLLEAQIAILATVGSNGRPQQSLVWFLAEDGNVRFSLNMSRQKTINLAKNPACSVTIVDPESGYRYLEVRGTAEIENDPDYAFADRVGAKYGSDLRVHDSPGETRVVVTVAPERVRGVDMRS
jgi:PPOX class probable F420-dependent enzyme